MNITTETEQYVLERSSIKDSLRKGLINYSKLSRQIIKETTITNKNFDAVLIALRRLENKLRKKRSFEKRIRDLLKDTKLEIKNKVLVCIIEKSNYGKNLLELQKKIKEQKGEVHIIEGVNVQTIIIAYEFEKLIDKYFKNQIIKKNKNLVKITLRSPNELEEVPGVLGYLYSLFSEKNINIVETMSCWTDTIFVIEEKNIEKTIKLLNF